MNQWVADVNSQGVQVVYTPDGDAQGRTDFANRTSDFAVTAEGFQGGSDTSQGRPYAYLPIAAGGTSFPYQIRFDGQQVENLRLSGETLVKIFTNQITNWDNPEITQDNNGVQLPSLPIIPVVQAEGSGSTYQLTNYFATDFASIWNPYAGAPGPTEYFPRQGNQIAQNGSNASMNYVASSEANGSIGYVEYSFPLSVNYPVVKVLNSAGYFTLPTQYNVAVSLEAAQINMDKSSPNYLLQNLTNVYVNPDPRTYPLSSYVYMIEPTGTYPSPESKVTTPMRQALADFAYYGICQGQKEIGPIGYSPLPVNLVEAAFGQIQQLQTADPGISLQNLNIGTCDNPTFIPGQPDDELPGPDRAAPPRLRPRGRRSVRRGRDPQRDRGDADVLRNVPRRQLTHRIRGEHDRHHHCGRDGGRSVVLDLLPGERVGGGPGVGCRIPIEPASSRAVRLGHAAGLDLAAGRAAGGLGPARHIGLPGRDRLPALAAQGRKGRSHPVRRLFSLVLAVTALTGVVFPAVLVTAPAVASAASDTGPVTVTLDRDAPRGRQWDRPGRRHAERHLERGPDGQPGRSPGDQRLVVRGAPHRGHRGQPELGPGPVRGVPLRPPRMPGHRFDERGPVPTAHSADLLDPDLV